MSLRLTNTMTRKQEEFSPLEDNHVRMYTCGPTVHDYAHIGNFRTYMFEDLLRRYLKYKGYKVTQVMNLTDIDDKTIRKSRELGISLDEYTSKYKKAFFEDIDTLRIERAEHYPEATTHVPEMVAMVGTLMQKGLAYEVEGNFYFSIAKFNGYGKLSHIDLEGLKPGARVASDEYEKESVSDFALWKAWDENDGDVYWETELGKGRPGWHLECSVMSMKYLGETFDIHTGGVDNIFPHHENEIAQSEGATGKPFAILWLHSEHLVVDGRKMAKSLNNFYTLRQVMERGYSAIAVRYALLSTHYRQQLNFTFERIEAAANALERYTDFHNNLADYPGGKSSGEADTYIDKLLSGFESSLDDDLNISAALAEVFDFIRDINRLKAENKLSADERDRALKVLKKIDTVLDFLPRAEEGIDDEIEALIQKRVEAKKRRDFAAADKIRDDLLQQGIILEDTPAGTKWKRKI
ncbi:MAG: cysteine--tRNA ligase [candidate division Zixibacteria bacterium HGW-Zixibacteria-1]|nr:MAG: cysteine--tRNA ligase [candidate division Zixibacteria bacterium HGW-Zixibacteria-1]